MSTTTVVSSTNNGTGNMESSNETNPGDNSKDPHVGVDDDIAPDSEVTGKSLSEALIFASTNPQYDDRLFIELQVQCMKIPSSNLGRTEHVHRNCF